MKLKTGIYFILLLGLMMAVPDAAHAQPDVPVALPTKSPENIPWSQVGAKAGADYQGDGLKVIATEQGARLHCDFQRLDGDVTDDGLSLTSTVTNTMADCFRVKAVAIGRQHTKLSALSARGTVKVNDKLVSFARSGLMEEYSVSMDGVRQDFVVMQRPAGAGELQVQLEITGARVEPAICGANLMLQHSGRKISYSRLRATDASGKELAARIKIPSGKLADAANAIAVIVTDLDATYPIRIDPTFSDANWVSLNPGFYSGANGSVLATVMDSQGNLYIGGSFTLIGTNTFNYIAKWDGTNWSSLGAGMNNIVNALAMSGTNLYVGGRFTIADTNTVNHIAKWDGSKWTTLNVGMNSPVYALVASGTNLYAGGTFTMAGTNTAYYVAKWNGSNWSPLGVGINSGVYSSSIVYALALSGTNLYVGGAFNKAGGIAATNIAMWNGSSWSALGATGLIITPGTPASVRAIAVSSNGIYAGGSFASADGSVVGNITKWNGSNWEFVGFMSGNITVYALAASGTNIYAGGDFQYAKSYYQSNSHTVNYIAKWDGSNWLRMGSGLNGTVYAITASDTNVYAGGSYGISDGITKWDGNSWSGLGPTWTNGYDEPVYAWAVSGNTIYAGGDFTRIGGVSANRVAKWDGSAWSALGSGMNNTVRALAISGNTLYAGGDFFLGDGSPADCIAKWNGNSWSALGSGLQYHVRALAVSGSTLYAGGGFTSAGTNTVNYIAKWDGNSWKALGSGMDSWVIALAVSGTNLYVGGGFTMAGTNTANYIARWNGTNWFTLGSGMNDWVYALAVSGTNLYAGGEFTMAGTNNAKHIAKWNGTNWSALGLGTTGGVDQWGFGEVFALAISGTNLYAGGFFITAGTNSASYIAKWDGTNWFALGSGANNTIYALAMSGSNLLVGGTFTIAGGKTSGYVAIANTTVDPPRIITQPINQNVVVTSNASFSVLAGGTTPFSFQWQKNATNLANQPNLSGVLTNILMFSTTFTNDSGNYQVVITNAYGSITSSIATLTLFLLPQNFIIGNANGNQLILQLIGTPNYPYVLQSATDLTPPINWQPVITNLADGNGLWIFTDTNTTGVPARYYRATTP